MTETPTFIHPAMALLLIKVGMFALNNIDSLDIDKPMEDQLSDEQLVQIIKEHDPSIDDASARAFLPTVRKGIKDLGMASQALFTTKQ